MVAKWTIKLYVFSNPVMLYHMLQGNSDHNTTHYVCEVN